jgi:hypothetical protein
VRSAGRAPAGLVGCVLGIWVACGCSSPAGFGAPDVELVELVDLDGVRHRPLAADAGRTRVVIAVTQDCPIANQYAPELLEIARSHGGDPVRFLLVHVDPDLDDAGARSHAAAYGFAGVIPVARDPRHAMVGALGVRATPEAFVVDASGRVRYRGRIDDRFADLGTKRAVPRCRDLRDAIDAVLEGRTVETPVTVPVGCLVPELPAEH